MVRTRPDTTQIRTQVEALSGVARAVNREADQFFSRLGIDRPGTIYTARRNKNLRFLQDFFQRNANDPAIIAAKQRLGELQGQNLTPGGEITGGVPSARVNPRLYDRYDPNELNLRALFQIADVGKRDDLVETIREQTDRSTESNLERIKRGERVVKDVVIVGGGQLASVAATIYSYAGTEATIITDGELGEPWTSQPIFINSATRQRFGGVDLPLLDGSTTPVTPSFQNNAIGADALLQTPGEVLEVQCKDGEVPTRDYIAGPGLGQLSAVNILSATNDIITGQRVDAKQLKVNDDGTKTLTIIGKDGKPQTIDAKTVIFLTGPGPEKFGIQDQQTRNDYDQGAEQFRASLNLAQATIDDLNRRITRGDGDRAALEAARDGISVKLPRVLSFTLVKEAYAFWVKNGRKNPSPLEQLWNRNGGSPIKIGVAGGGDTSSTEIELALGLGPDSGYPADFVREARQRITTTATIFNAQYEEAEDYRVRYQRLYKDDKQDVQPDPRVTPVTGVRVESARLVGDKVRVQTRPKDAADNATATNAGEFDYFFVSTGLDKSPVPDDLKQALGDRFGIVQGNNFGTVALGSAELGVLVAGSATNFTAKDFPPEVSGLIDALGIRENTISIWVNSLLLQRCILGLGARGVLQFPRSDDDLSEFAVERPRRPDRQDLINRLLAGVTPTFTETTDIFQRQGEFTGKIDSQLLARLAIQFRREQATSNPNFSATLVEAVANSFANRFPVSQESVNFYTSGASRAIRSVEIDVIEREARQANLTRDQFEQVLYGYFAGALSVANYRSIGALQRVAEITERRPDEVIGEVLEIINQVRIQRPDLNQISGLSRGDGRPVSPIDDNMRDAGFVWSEEKGTYRFVDTQRFPGESGDILVDALIEEGQRILARLRVNPRDVEQRILGASGTSDKTQKTQQAVPSIESYMREVTAIVIADAIRNEDFLLEDISQRKLDGLIGRINAGAESGVTRSDRLDRIFGVQTEYEGQQLADFCYGYFAAAIASRNSNLIGSPANPRILATAAGFLRSSVPGITVPGVVEQMLPIFSRARRETPYSLFDSSGVEEYSREIDRQLSQFGYVFDQRVGEYVRR